MANALETHRTIRRVGQRSHLVTFAHTIVGSRSHGGTGRIPPGVDAWRRHRDSCGRTTDLQYRRCARRKTMHVCLACKRRCSRQRGGATHRSAGSSPHGRLHRVPRVVVAVHCIHFVRRRQRFESFVEVTADVKRRLIHSSTTSRRRVGGGRTVRKRKKVRLYIRKRHVRFPLPGDKKAPTRHD